MTRPVRHLRTWWLPLVLLLLPATGTVPAHRDLPGYFAPIRSWTATEILGGRIPLLNPWNGCGEPWFANPQTAPFAPPTWPWFVLPPHWALTTEIALHLMWLALGAGLLARRLGADPVTRTAAETGAFLAGPVLVLTGTLNNLETLAWAPWIVLAACAGGGSALTALPVLVAAAWFAGAPVLWAAILASAFLLADSKPRVVLGIALGTGLAAVQIGPFLAWAATGDRGAQAVPEAMLAGSVSPAGWLSLLVPGTPAGNWAETLFLGGAILAAAAIGARRRPLFAAAATGLAVLATLPSLGGGGLYLALTGGLVRYPGRFAVLSALLLLVLGLLGLRAWLRGEARWETALAGLATLVFAGKAPPLDMAGATCLGVLLLAGAAWPRRPAPRWSALAVTVLLSLGLAHRLLLPAPVSVLDPPAWKAARGNGRLWSPLPGPKARRDLSRNPEVRALWPVGYTNLLTGTRRVGTEAPVSFRDIARLEWNASRGPSARWWVESAAGRWIVLRRPLREGGITPAAHRDGLWLHENPRAWPMVTVAGAGIGEGERPHPVPGAVTVRFGPETITIHTLVDRPGVAVVSLAPLPGWRWRLDERPVRVRRGPSVVQQIPIPPGAHRLEGRYREPLLLPGGVLSALAAMTILVLALVIRRREPSP